MFLELSIKQIELLKEALPFWCVEFPYACIFDSNQINSACRYDSYELIAGVANESTKTYTHLESIELENNWKLGYVTYEFNHSLHGINAIKTSPIEFNGCFFFEPQIQIILIKNSNRIEIIGGNEETIDSILNFKPNKPYKSVPEVKAKTSKEKYLADIQKIKDQIREGDFYELNYCIEFCTEDIEISPAHVFQKLKLISPTPFSAFIKHHQKYLLCASPERFLKKEGNQLIAQPIKGTAKRSKIEAEDALLKKNLLESEKERAENIMIVDLMRNDLAQCSKVGSVKVEELLGIYSFATVHQMISTITSEVKPDIKLVDIFNKTFPMGSMTGAPKREVIHNINNYEPGARGIFSGCVGYISPNSNFDFNVVIRSIVYNDLKKYLSFHVGSAITFDADPEAEYEECMLKSRTMFKSLDTE